MGFHVRCFHRALPKPPEAGDQGGGVATAPGVGLGGPEASGECGGSEHH